MRGLLGWNDNGDWAIGVVLSWGGRFVGRTEMRACPPPPKSPSKSFCWRGPCFFCWRFSNLRLRLGRKPHFGISGAAAHSSQPSPANLSEDCLLLFSCLLLKRSFTKRPEPPPSSGPEERGVARRGGKSHPLPGKRDGVMAPTRWLDLLSRTMRSWLGRLPFVKRSWSHPRYPGLSDFTKP